MNNRNKRSLLAVFVVVIFSLVAVLLVGCGGKEASPSEGVISEVVMTSAIDAGGRPVDTATVFSDNASVFICFFKVSNFPVGTEIKADWIYVGGDPEVEAEIGQNLHFDTRTGTIEREGTGYTYAWLERPPMPGYTWPHGNYKVSLLVDDQEKGSAYFSVE